MQKTENITVAIRFRPCEQYKDTESYIHLDTEQNFVEIRENDKEIQRFCFDHVFNSSSTQENVFTKVAKNAIECVCQGYNATIFAYGSTSSGKTYTMFGNENTEINKGIIPRSCDILFQNINKSEEVIETNIKCSFLEIYREQIRDLLDNHKNEVGGLKLRKNNEKGVYVQGLIEKYVYNSQDILNTIKEGVSQRTTSSTALNSVSSRSHAVLTLIVSQKMSTGIETISKLHLIDLAGSENVNKSEVQGIGLSEAQTINKSLSCLGNVINSLLEKEREHIPYRESKLTYLLQDSLGGNSKTILIATASLSSLCYSETMSTLKFAKRAKQIKNLPKINKNESVSNLLQTIDILKKRISDLETKCNDSQIILQAVENTKNDTKQLVLFKTKCERLEKKITLMEDENKKTIQRNEEAKDIFKCQRELAKKTSKDLYKERLRNYTIVSELEQLKSFYNSMQEYVSNPEILQLIINRTKINKFTPIIETSDSIDEIESP